MSHPAAAILFSLLCPWLALVRVLQFLAGGKIGQRGPIRLVVLGVAAIGILALPIQGFSLAGWIRGIEANFSVPLTALLAVGVWENEFSRRLLSDSEKVSGWAFGFLGGLVFYPFAMGLGRFDPFEWGWTASPLFAASGILTVWLLWKRNRCGIVLLLACLAYNLRLLESDNYWDYLLDPVYFAIGMVIFMSRLFVRVRKTAGRKAYFL